MLKHLTTLASLLFALAATPVAAEDIKAGKKVFKKCKACHTVKPEKHKVGPSLHGILGKAAGSAEGYKSSPALSASGIVWDTESMTAFLKDPKGTIPGNKMSFGGLKKDDEIVNLIAYIKAESEE
ncbi:MAG: cytochrome c family protein [Rhizobiaceae bacterium]|nr:cytochrome c family protein [Rhizobiaceae bacterium]